MHTQKQSLAAISSAKRAQSQIPGASAFIIPAVVDYLHHCSRLITIKHKDAQ